MSGAFWVFIGGGLGSLARYLVNLLAIRLWPPGGTLGNNSMGGGISSLPWLQGLPVATLMVNVLGSFVMGCVVSYANLRWSLPVNAKLFLTTGLLGGFTTFSAFSLEVWQMLDKGAWLQAVVYVGLSFTLAVAAVALGWILVRT